MKEVASSIKERLISNLSNPLYGTFIISWSIFHWNFLYSLFFLSEDKIWESQKILKNDYLISRYFDFSDPYFYISWILPFVVTYIVIWRLPNWLFLRAYEENSSYETGKVLIQLSQKTKIEKEQAKLEQESAKKVEAVVTRKRAEKIVKDLDPAVEWARELKKYENSLLEGMRYARQAIYQTNGAFSAQQGDKWDQESYIPSNILSRLDAFGLVKIERNPNHPSRSVVSFTEKGKYFLRQLQEQGLL